MGDEYDEEDIDAETASDAGEDAEDALLLTSKTTRMGFRILFWSLVGLTFAIAVTALILSSLNSSTLHSDDLDHIAKLVRGMRTGAVITGANPTKDDINVKHDIYAGRNVIVNNTLYARDGIVSASGSASFNQSIVSHYGDITAEHGSVNARCMNELWTFNVSSASPVSIAENDVVSLVGGRVRLGFGQMNDITVATSIGTIVNQAIDTFSLSATRTVQLQLDGTDDLVFQLIDLDPQTLEPTVYTTYSLGLGASFTTFFPFKGVGVAGDDSRFMVLYTNVAGTQVQVAGVQITGTSGTTVAFTTSLANAVGTAAQTNPTVQDFIHLYDGVYAALFAEDGGLSIKAFTLTTPGAGLWTFTLGTISVVQAGAGFTAGTIYNVGSIDLMYTSGTTAYVALSWGGGSTGTTIRANALVVTGTTWTAIDTAQTKTVDLTPGSTSQHQALALAGDGTQFAVGFQAGGNDYIFGRLVTFTLTRSTMVVTAVTGGEFTFNAYEGYFVTLFSAPRFELVSLGGSATDQQIGACYGTSLTSSSAYYCQRFSLDAGVYVNSSNAVALSAYNGLLLSLGSINDTAFSFMFTTRDGEDPTSVRFGVVSYDEDQQLEVARTKGLFPIGVAVSAADAGNYVTVLISGCKDDALDFAYESGVQLCLHGDGSIQPSSFVLDAAADLEYQPVCSCAHIADGTIMCDRPFTHASRTVFYNQA